MRAVKKVVFMGMGEPAHNLENVLEAIDLLGTEGGIGHKNLVFSTVGDPRVFEALPRQRIARAGAVAHTTAELCAHLLPRVPRIARSAGRTRRTVCPRHGLSDPVSMDAAQGRQRRRDELDAIVRLLKGKYGVLNVSFNSLEGDDYKRPDPERIREIVRSLHSRGVLTKIRNSAGQDVDGGCGCAPPPARSRGGGCARARTARPDASQAVTTNAVNASN